MRKHDFTAVAHVRGSEAYLDIRGCVRFRQMDGGVLVTAEIRGLPGDDGIFAFHIHSGTGGSGNEDEPPLLEGDENGGGSGSDSGGGSGEDDFVIGE